MLVRGTPEHIRSDNNGSGFIAGSCIRWLDNLSMKTLYIEPGCSRKNRYCESFNGKSRDGFLTGEIFYSLKEAQILTERRRVLFLIWSSVPRPPCSPSQSLSSEWRLHVKQDVREAVRWVRTPAEQWLFRGIDYIAVLYLEGARVSQDIPKVFLSMKKAANQR
jgi:transposase InsO family protein